jgi:hypothetical protein
VRHEWTPRIDGGREEITEDTGVCAKWHALQREQGARHAQVRDSPRPWVSAFGHLHHRRRLSASVDCRGRDQTRFPTFGAVCTTAADCVLVAHEVDCCRRYVPLVISRDDDDSARRGVIDAP